jgi:ectoine hydroxylase-related dioxygenase (phytanoyl-CoA dioxygenase family)
MQHPALASAITASTAAATAPALSGAQLRQYRADGYLIVRGVFPAPEIAALAAEAERLSARSELIDVNNIRCRYRDDVHSGACNFDCFDPVIDISPPFAAIARDPRILAIAAALCGEPAHLFKDKLIYKRPGNVGYALHQDYIPWPSFPTSFITVVVAIDAASDDNGATEVFPGCHHRGYLSPRDGNYHELPVDAIDPSKGVLLRLQPGDLAVFGCYTPHRSAPNHTSTSRRLLYTSYNAHSDGGDSRAAHYREFHLWLKDKYAEHGKTSTYFR